MTEDMKNEIRNEMKMKNENEINDDGDIKAKITKIDGLLSESCVPYIVSTDTVRTGTVSTDIDVEDTFNENEKNKSVEGLDSISLSDTPTTPASFMNATSTTASTIVSLPFNASPLNITLTLTPPIGNPRPLNTNPTLLNITPTVTPPKTPKTPITPIDSFDPVLDGPTNETSLSLLSSPTRKTKQSTCRASAPATPSSGAGSASVTAGYPVRGLLGSGLGFGLKVSLDNGEPDGSSGRADGVAVYLKHGATLVLAHVLGPSVYGGIGITSWAERTAAMKKVSAAFPTSTSTTCPANGELNIELFITDNDEVYIYIYIYIYINIYKDTYIYIYKDICIYIKIYTFILVYISICIYYLFIYTSTYKDIYIDKKIYVCMYIKICRYILVYIFICL
jgi:hypothetical protein